MHPIVSKNLYFIFLHPSSLILHPSLLFSLPAILFGLIAGSFFNVLIYRLPRRESILFPASHCPACNRPIRPWENVPLASYALLGGKCAGCRQPISPLYPIIELLTAGAALLLWHTLATSRSSAVAPDVRLFIQCFTLLLMIPITVIDLRHYLIPDALTLPLIAAGLAASFLPGGLTPAASVIGGCAGGGTLFLIGWIGKLAFRKGDAMGGGDIKLLAAAGVIWGAKIALLTIFLGSLLGALAGGAAMLSGRLGRSHRIPFAPFLAVGLWTAVLFGDAMVRGYLRLF
jgi:leader peptidase (prepilin peptidase)/N-methyltransferase